VPYLFAILPGLVLLGLIVAGLLRLRGGGEEPPARDWARDAVMRPVDDRNVQKSPDTPENTSQEVSDAEPAEPSHSRTSPVVSEQKAPDRKKVKTTAVSRPAKPASGKERAATSLLEKGREAIRRESYPEAVALFQKASGKPAMEREARIRLVEAYVRNGESRKAILHYQERPIEDGYCQLWLGHAYHRVGDFQSAEKAYQRASKSSSAVSRGVRVDALFALADTREAMFMRQPNATNRALMVRAWEAFQRAACGKQNADKRCAEAAQRSARLSR
jgi:tetratricopeptide (TPR) repeat protein